jgi:hypothetical protein
MLELQDRVVEFEQRIGLLLEGKDSDQQVHHRHPTGVRQVVSELNARLRKFRLEN